MYEHDAFKNQNTTMHIYSVDGIEGSNSEPQEPRWQMTMLQCLQYVLMDQR